MIGFEVKATLPCFFNDKKIINKQAGAKLGQAQTKLELFQDLNWDELDELDDYKLLDDILNQVLDERLDEM